MFRIKVTTVPPNYWLITDTHFNHHRMVELCGRPENFTDLIIENWQRLVKPEDIVFHLGDVIFSRAAELRSINERLPGKKILVRGNHDMERSIWYMRRGFDFVCKAFVFRDILFTHIPAKTLPDGCTVNIHGHLHNSHHRDEEYEPRPWHRLLAIEKENLSPVLLSEFLSRG